MQPLLLNYLLVGVLVLLRPRPNHRECSRALFTDTVTFRGALSLLLLPLNGIIVDLPLKQHLLHLRLSGWKKTSAGAEKKTS